MSDDLTVFADAIGATTTRTVDGFGETIQETSPASGATTYWYDGGGNLTKKVDAGGIEIDYAYDAANRRTSMSSPGGLSATYTWDETAGGNVGIGRLTTATIGSESTHASYDAQGRVTSARR